MQFPNVLIISNRYDFSTDFVCVELNKQNINYLRINRDDLKDYEINFDPITPRLIGNYQGKSFTIANDNLRSVYFRAPTFLREVFQDPIEEEEQLIKTQWAAFVRSLCVFENAKWLNYPPDIYKAEIKSYQLYKANKLGFKIPETKISNTTERLSHDYLAIKSIDTAILNCGDEEAFIYTELYKRNDLKINKFSSPFFIQQGLVPKVDIRTTVIENEVISVKISNDKAKFEDWRKTKDQLDYSIFKLPIEVENLAINYVKNMNLRFGAIDFVLYKNEFYFIEINPTGEWSWLQQNTGFKIDSLLVNSLKC